MSQFVVRRQWHTAIAILLLTTGCNTISDKGADLSTGGLPAETTPVDANTTDAKTPNPLFVPPRMEPHSRGRVLVRYSDSTDAGGMVTCNAMAGVLKVVCEVPLVPGLHVVEVAEGTEIATANILTSDQHVLYAEPDWTITLNATPNEIQFNQLWGLRNTGQPINGAPGVADADIRATSAWDLTTGDPNLRIAVIDTGIDYSHPDLADNIWTNPGEIPGNGIDDDRNGYADDIHGYDFYSNDGDPMDDHNHGTHVAGTIGGVGNNGSGIAGVNWRCKLVALKFMGSNGGGSISGAIMAIDYCVRNNIKLSNNSWGGGGYSRAMYDALSRARNAGHIFVAAAGNSNLDNDILPSYPASYDLDNIIAVAALTNGDDRAYFSNYGRNSVDLGAPGHSILSCIRNNSYAYASGTSMAAPHVTGVVGLVMARSPALTATQIRERILGRTRPVAALQGTTVTGGCVDAAAAVSGDAPPRLPAPPSNLRVTGVTSSSISIAWDDKSDNETGFEVYYAIPGIDWRLFTTTAADATRTTITGLAPNTSYRVMVRSHNAYGNSPDQVIGPIQTGLCTPTAPSNLRETGVTPSSISIAWNDQSDNETGFEVYYAIPGSDWILFTTTAANATSATITELAPNTGYLVMVRSHNACGNSADQVIGPIQTGLCNPTAPNSLRETGVTPSSISIAWNDQSNNETGFEVYYAIPGIDWRLFTTTAMNATSATITGLAPNTGYLIMVRSHNACGNSPDKVIGPIQTGLCTPTAPSNLRENGVTSSSISIAWNDQSDNETGFEVYYAIPGIDWTLFTTTAADATSTTITELVPNTGYLLMVRSHNACGNSADQVIGPIQTAVCTPTAPSNLRATGVTHSSISIAWNDQSNNETGFEVYYAIPGIDWALFTTTAADVTSTTITGLAPNTGYLIMVRSHNACGNSADQVIGPIQTAVCTLTPPSNLRATGVTHNSISIAWNDQSNNETGFEVYYAIPGIDWRLFTTTAMNATSATITGLAPNTGYLVMVRSHNECGNSADQVIGPIQTGVCTPTAPSNLRATGTTPSSISIAWNDRSNNETGFEVYYAIPGIDWRLFTTTAANATSTTITGLAPNTGYLIMVRSHNACGNSPDQVIGPVQTPPCSRPMAPANLHPTRVTSTEITVGWTDQATNEEGYDVWVAYEGFDFIFLYTQPANWTEAVIGALAPNYNYYILIRAQNSCGSADTVIGPVRTLP